MLGLLVCLLVGSLRALAAYLDHHDTKLWEEYEETNAFDDEGKVRSETICRLWSTVEDRAACTLRHERPSRGSRYMLSHPSTPVTKINIHTSPRRAAVIASSSSPSKSGSPTAIGSPSTPLRSALSRSPPSSKRFSSAQSFFFGPRRSTSTTTSRPSPKSVRWADQIHVSVTPTAEMSVQKEGADELQTSHEAEMDIATRTIGSRNHRPSDVLDIFQAPTHHPEPLPAYEALSPCPAVAVGSCRTRFPDWITHATRR